MPVTRSSKRMPSAISRSACWIAVLTQASPCMPIMPRLSGCDAGNAPMPSSVIATGICAALGERAELAPSRCPRIRPCPARMTGRSAALISASASRNSALLRRRRRAGRAAAAPRPPSRTSSDDCCASLVMSMSTGPGRPAAREVERLADRRRDVGRARHQVVVLGDRQRDAGDVGLLERVGSDQPAADLARDADDRRRVHHRGRQAGHHVGGAGARGRDRDADLAGRARVAVGHVGRALLVAGEDVADRDSRASRRRRAGSRRPDSRRRSVTPSRTRHSQRICAPVCFIDAPVTGIAAPALATADGASTRRGRCRACAPSARTRRG